MASQQRPSIGWRTRLRQAALRLLLATAVGWAVIQPLILGPLGSGFGTNVGGLMLVGLVAGIGAVVAVFGLVCTAFAKTRELGFWLIFDGVGFALGVALAFFEVGS